MLVDAPLVDQLNEGTLDGQSDENARANCVPASLTAGIRALVPGATVDGDSLKDAVYGQGYTGATDPARYVAYLASQYGVTMTRYPADGTSATGAALVQQIIAGLQRHEPVTGAIPSQWGTAPADPLNPVGGTHEVTFCDYDGTNLTAMNPWPVNGASAFYQTQPASWWASRLVYGRVFVLSGGHMSITVDETLGLFSEPAAGHWVCGKTGAALTGAFLDAYTSMPSSGTLAGLTELGLPLHDPQYLNQAQYPQAAAQVFERGVLIYDPLRKFDNPPGVSGPIYRAHVDVTAFYANQQADPNAAKAESFMASVKALVAAAA